MSGEWVAITGATGLVGAALCPALEEAGYQIKVMSRGRARGLARPEVVWDPVAGTVDAAGLEGVRAVVHLAGENIAGGRWSRAMKDRVRDSRVKGTGAVARAVAGLEAPPEVLICASAIGFYGDRGDEVLTEESPAGDGYLGEVCAAWEEAAEPARQAGVRVVHLRIGVVLARAGGALGKMLLPFKLCVGGVVGPGTQWMSWVSRDDVVGAVRFALETPDLSGAVNVVAPNPVTNRDFTRALGAALGRPTIFPLPAFVVRTVFGEMGEALLLGSARVHPDRLRAAGFSFQHPELAGALAAALA